MSHTAKPTTLNHWSKFHSIVLIINQIKALKLTTWPTLHVLLDSDSFLLLHHLTITLNLYHFAIGSSATPHIKQPIFVFIFTFVCRVGLFSFSFLLWNLIRIHVKIRKKLLRIVGNLIEVYKDLYQSLSFESWSKFRFLLMILTIFLSDEERVLYFQSSVILNFNFD